MKQAVRILILLVSWHAYGFDPSLPEVDDVIVKSTNFIAQQQFKSDNPLYLTGEFPTDIRAYFIPAILGVGRLFAKPLDEPTAFASSSVVNLLAETYLLRPSLTPIPDVIHRATDSLSYYKAGDVYSYYRWQTYRGVFVRGPRAQGYVPAYIRGLTNVPPDADTTSTTFTALAYMGLIDHGIPLNQFPIPQGTLDAFSTYRDIHRTSHYFDWIQGIRSSQAFLTWLQDDQDPNMPKGIFKRPEKGPRIPFGRNDVDCVVNANVMRMLTVTGNTDHPGYKDTCGFLNWIINKNKQKLCGIYYPNSYAVFFSISNVYKAGAQCLEDSRLNAIQYIITTQKDDGSWVNEPGIGRNDPVQSTALALNALTNYAQKGDPLYRKAVEDGMTFLLRNVRKGKDDTLFWDGEVFFSAVAQARNTVLWRSDSYTTALATLALIKAQDFLKAAP
jgi:hypothetical protein